MLKKYLLMLLVCACFGSAWAAVDVNSATEAQLQTLKGIGPSTARAIVKERGDHGPYKSGDDLSTRVKGVGPKSLAKLEQQGLTVPGAASSHKSEREKEKSGEAPSGKAAKK